MSLASAAFILLISVLAFLIFGGSAPQSTSVASATPTIPATVAAGVPLTVTPTVDSPTLSDLLLNTGFEDGFSGWGQGYTYDDGTIEPNSPIYTVDIDPTVAHTGSASAHVLFTDTVREHQPKTWAYISTRVPANIFRGMRVRYSAYLRTKEAAIGATLWMDVIGNIDGRPADPSLPLSWDNSRNGIRQVYGTTDWTQESIVLDVPQEATYILIGLKTGSVGQTWMDDVQIEAVGLDVPSTDRAGKKNTNNLDFEQGLTDWEKHADYSGQTDFGTGAAMAHGGSQGAYINCSGANTTAEDTSSLFYAFMYGQYYRNKKIEITAFVNVDKAPLGAAFSAYATVLNGSSYPDILSDTVKLSPVSGKSVGWQKVDIQLDLPERVNVLDFGLVLNCNGEVWMDDVELKVLGPADLTPTPTLSPTP